MRLLTGLDIAADPRENNMAILRGERQKQQAEEPWTETCQCEECQRWRDSK